MKTLLFIRYIFFISIFVCLTPHNLLAEYRVYQYQVTDRLRENQAGASQIITTSFDPITYLAYHGGGLSTRIDLLRSWHCVGYTGEFKEFCLPPLEKLDQRIKK